MLDLLHDPHRVSDFLALINYILVMLPERAYCADFSYPLAVICTAERHIGVIDLTKPDKFYRVSPRHILILKTDNNDLMLDFPITPEISKSLNNLLPR